MARQSAKERDSQGCLQLCSSQEDGSPPSVPQIIYLRRFKDLRALSLSGNPIAEAEDYKMSVWAYLPDLVYLDSRRIDDHMASVSLWASQLWETASGPLVSWKETLRRSSPCTRGGEKGQLPLPYSFPCLCQNDFRRTFMVTIECVLTVARPLPWVASSPLTARLHRLVVWIMKSRRPSEDQQLARISSLWQSQDSPILYVTPETILTPNSCHALICKTHCVISHYFHNNL